MNKKKILILTISSILVITISLGVYFFYKDYRIKHAYKLVELNRDEIEVFTKINLKDIIKNINGSLEENPIIDTTKIGKKKINFEYTTDENIKVPYTIEINIVDKTPPMISLINSYTVTVGSGDFTKELFCGDNYDDNPKCTIEGEYDLNTEGTYRVKFKGVDSSNNESSHEFNLNVITPSSNKPNSSSERITTKFEDIVQKHKTNKTKIGIDISHWQGEIDYEKVKESGVEFVYIRVGRGDGIGNKYVEDDMFQKYIKGFNKVNIPVGIYFYSSANNKKAAIAEAKWVISKIKKYKVDLEVVFDWENWADFQEYKISFYHLTEAANAFNDTVKKAGYNGMLYSSKNYLENIWFDQDYPVWLAHYTKETNYEGAYKVWQICNNGKVGGIDDNLVDIDIMYE